MILRFSGDDWVDVPNEVGLKPAVFTVEIWAKPTAASIADYLCPLTSFFGDAGGRYGSLIYPDAGAWSMEFGNGTTDYNVLTGGTSAAGTWAHIAITYDGTTVVFLVDGVAVDSTVDTFAHSAWFTYPWSIGRTLYGGGSEYPWAGDLCDFRIWSVARSEAQIAAAKDTRLFGDEAGLVAYWRMDDGTGTVLEDDVGGYDTAAWSTTPTWQADAAPLAEAAGVAVPALASQPVSLLVPTYSPVFADPPALSGLSVALLVPAPRLVYDVPVMDAQPVALLAPTYSPVFADLPALSGLSVALLVPHLQPTTANVPALDAQPVALLVPHLQPTTANVPALDAQAVALLVPNTAWSTDAQSQTIYRLTLTGAADATTDVVLPIASFQARLSTGEESYLQVVVPDVLTYSAAVTARANGQLVLSRGVRLADGAETLAEIARVTLDSIAEDRGGNSASITLAGYRQITNTTPKTRDITGVSYRHTGTGERRYRCTPDAFLVPGDTASFPELGESITVGAISYAVSAAREQMDLTEAAD